jgi:hypothetical protein
VTRVYVCNLQPPTFVRTLWPQRLILLRGLELAFGVQTMANSPAIQIANLHEAHPRVRAKDWRSPLVSRLLGNAKYKDGGCEIDDSFRPPAAASATQQKLPLSWEGLKSDFDQAVNTYQEPVITEFATLGLACILVSERAHLQITEVTRRGEKADYWLGDRQFLLEVSGQQTGSLEGLCSAKADQLLANPFEKSGYVCVASYDKRTARLWFYDGNGGS